jgi:8-oxo-dGTP diphosphatase
VAGYGAVQPHRQVVVGAAIVDGDRVLAAQRSEPPALAGLWEFPGGKVDPGETDEAALVRECREELGVDVMLGARIGRDWPIGEYGILRVWLAGIAAGELTAHEHAALRWLAVDELDDVEWIPADRAIVDRLAGMLRDRQLNQT